MKEVGWHIRNWSRYYLDSSNVSLAKEVTVLAAKIPSRFLSADRPYIKMDDLIENIMSKTPAGHCIPEYHEAMVLELLFSLELDQYERSAALLILGYHDVETAESAISEGYSIADEIRNEMLEM